MLYSSIHVTMHANDDGRNHFDKKEIRLASTNAVFAICFRDNTNKNGSQYLHGYKQNIELFTPSIVASSFITVLKSGTTMIDSHHLVLFCGNRK